MKIEKSYEVRDHWKVCESPRIVIGPGTLLLYRRLGSGTLLLTPSMHFACFCRRLLS